jgi:imidazolonepropionase-like amidohydrolase
MNNVQTKRTGRTCLTITACVAFATAVALGQSLDRAPRTPTFALEHVRLIDGTGASAKDDQTIVVDHDRIRAVGPASSVAVPPDAELIDLAGRTVIPGLVGMHDHLFYEVESAGSGEISVPAQRTFAKLYLANGVTTVRTTGTIDFDGDVRLKERIDAGKEPGPRIFLTSGYFGATTPQPDPDGIVRLVNQYADRGATSIKAYTTLRSSELKAAIAAAHERGLRVTGHLCAVGFREAASFGIDNIEHGLPFDTEFYSGKRFDECPDQNSVIAEMANKEVSGDDIRRTIDELVKDNVALTSTLAVLESVTGVAADKRVRLLLVPRLQEAYDAAAKLRTDPSTRTSALYYGAFHKEQEFERAFVARGGTLMAGVDPTGWGGVAAGFGDRRELELLVEEGFPVEKAIQIATSNGATFLRQSDIGTIAAGNKADLVVIRGDLARDIYRLRNIDFVVKDGVTYDPEKLIDAAQGTIGASDVSRFFTWRALGIALLLPALVLVRLRRASRRM